MSSINNPVPPVPTQADSAVLSQAIRSPNSTYKLMYFNLHGRGQILRTILSFSGAQWEEITPEWPAMAKDTPFGCVPIVYETASNGTVLELAESFAIERYLAKKFHLFGANEYEQHKIDQFCTSTDTNGIVFGQKVVHPPREKVQLTLEEMAVAANTFYDEMLSKFITMHEAHLRKNGSNGHYVGNGFTLADLKTAVFMERVLLLRPQGANEVPFSAEKSPELWKVRQTVNSQPGVAAWLKSQRYQELDNITQKFFRIV